MGDQEQPSDLLTYHLKFRFYFQPYEPEVVTSPASLVVPKPASHQNLIRLYFQTEAWAGEYDVLKLTQQHPRKIQFMKSPLDGRLAICFKIAIREKGVAVPEMQLDM